MHILNSESARLTPEFGVESGRWTQYPDLGELPFGAMWCVIPPGGHTEEDCHVEKELVVVAKGAARIESPAATFDAGPGTAVLLGSEERHVIHNRSTDQPLVLLGVYWVPTDAVEGTNHGT